jgi:hypothetical protein
MKKRILFLITLTIFFYSCEDINSNKSENGEGGNQNSRTLKRFAYKQGNTGQLFFENESVDSIGKQGLFISVFNHFWGFTDSLNNNNVLVYQDANVIYFHKQDNEYIRFNDVSLGSLALTELSKSKSNFFKLDTMPCDTIPHDSTQHSIQNPYYKWENRNGILPRDLDFNASPLFKATVVNNNHGINHQVKPLPSLTATFTNIQPGDHIQLDTTLTITFQNDLEKGTIVGIQIIPFFIPIIDSVILDSTNINMNEIKNVSTIYNDLYLEIVLDQNQSSVTFSGADLLDIKTLILENFPPGSKLHADIFAFNHKEHDQFSFTSKNESQNSKIITTLSSSISVNIDYE